MQGRTLNTTPRGKYVGETEAKASEQEVVASEEVVEGEHEDQNDEGQEAEDQDGSDGEQEAEDEEAEIVLTGDAGSQPDNEHRGIRKRINKLNRKVEKAQEGQSEAAKALEVERERNKLLELALEQQKLSEAKGPPDPDDYDEGASDPKYIAALRDHLKEDVIKEVTKSLPKEQPKPEKQSVLVPEERQVKHYKRAGQLKVKDYDETEDKAIEILGREVVTQVIGATDKSPEILYYLGKNPDRAEDIKELIKTNPVQGVFEIGALSRSLEVRPKARTKPAPDPDNELEGGSMPTIPSKRGPKGATFE